MTTTIPNHLFLVWSPDQVAECLDGISQPLYRKLWELAEQLPEDTSEVPDNFEVRCLNLVWDRFTIEEQIELNRAAEAHDQIRDYFPNQPEE